MKRIGIVHLLVVLVLLLSVLPAAAQATPTPPDSNTLTVGTTATLPEGTVPPVIENAWILRDEVPNLLNIGIEAPWEDDPLTPGVQITPNLGNDPAQGVAWFAVVSDPSGRDDIQFVFVRVLHPDGTFKYQVHLTQRLACDPPATGPQLSLARALTGAVATGQKSQEDADLLLERCRQDLVYVFAGDEVITKDQPFGLYRWQAYASDRAGAVGTIAEVANWDVLPIAGLAADFSAVNFGTISPANSQITDGNAVFCENDGLPTLMSIGNVWLNLNVNYEELIGATFGKVVDVFDLAVGMIDSDPLTQPRVEIERIDADANRLVANYILYPNCPTKVQFSIHPEIMGLIRSNPANPQPSLPSDTYMGDIDLWGTPSATQWTPGWAAALDACPAEGCGTGG